MLNLREVSLIHNKTIKVIIEIHILYLTSLEILYYKNNYETILLFNF